MKKGARWPGQGQGYPGGSDGEILKRKGRGEAPEKDVHQCTSRLKYLSAVRKMLWPRGNRKMHLLLNVEANCNVLYFNRDLITSLSYGSRVTKMHAQGKKRVHLFDHKII